MHRLLPHCPQTLYATGDVADSMCAVFERKAATGRSRPRLKRAPTLPMPGSVGALPAGSNSVRGADHGESLPSLRRSTHPYAAPGAPLGCQVARFPGVEPCTISVGPPPAQGRFCRTNRIDVARQATLGAHKDVQSGLAYGTLIRQQRSERRAILVLARGAPSATWNT